MGLLELNHTNWQQALILNELMGMINERRTAMYYNNLPTFSAGDDIQSSESWNEIIQGLIDSKYGSDDYPVILPFSYYFYDIYNIYKPFHSFGFVPESVGMVSSGDPIGSFLSKLIKLAYQVDIHASCIDNNANEGVTIVHEGDPPVIVYEADVMYAPNFDGVIVSVLILGASFYRHAEYYIEINGEKFYQADDSHPFTAPNMRYNAGTKLNIKIGLVLGEIFMIKDINPSIRFTPDYEYTEHVTF